MDTILKELKKIISNDFSEIQNIKKGLIDLEKQLEKGNYLKAHKKLTLTLKPTLSKRFPNVMSKLESLNDHIVTQIRDYKIGFTDKFLKACHKADLVPVSGDYIKGFRIKGIVEVTINYDKEETNIGTYSKLIKLKSLNVDDIIAEAERINKRLFHRKWNETDFYKELYQAYLKVTKGKFNEEVSLKEVQTNIWVSRQGELFWKSFDKDKIKDYPTDEFSVDLSKLIGKKPNMFGEEFVLLEGVGGIIVYDIKGNFKSFKFITFKKRI